jgi:hypothetical protein
MIEVFHEAFSSNPMRFPVPFAALSCVCADVVKCNIQLAVL